MLQNYFLILHLHICKTAHIIHTPKQHNFEISFTSLDKNIFH